MGVAIAVGNIWIRADGDSGVGVAESAVTVGVGGFVGSDLGGSCVDEGSTSAFATTLASGVGVSAISLPPPQATGSNMNAADRRNDNVSFRFISVPPSCT